MTQAIQLNPDSLESIRVCIAKMSDGELLRYGTACKSLCDPKANFGEPPRERWVVQLREAREEWSRRHPKSPLSESIHAIS